MPKVKGKSGTIIVLLSNPGVRRLVVRGAGKVAASAATFVAARADKSDRAASDPTPGTPAAPQGAGAVTAARPASTGESAAVESIVASVAKPLAERLSGTSAGRSALQTINSISGQALGGSPPARQAGAAVAGFVGNILAGAQAGRPEARSPQPSVKFTPIRPSSTTPAAPVQTMQWPPRPDSATD